MYIPSPAINMYTSVNKTFTADKLNAARSYLTLLTVDIYTIDALKHSSPVWAITMDWTGRETHVAVIALHMCLYFCVAKTDVMRVFVYHSVVF